MKKDLLKKIEDLIEKQKVMNLDEIALHLTFRELQYLKIWIKTAYANEDALDEALGLK